ncbi:uncharacterized protein TNCV_3973091 [Trichonephila clavipes]|nr:uncharacterized protein TNCV_3973091 [Trichonephila clavipes]
MVHGGKPQIEATPQPHCKITFDPNFVVEILQRLPGLKSLCEKKDVVAYKDLLTINGTKYLTFQETARSSVYLNLRTLSMSGCPSGILGLGWNPGEGMDVCKCIVPSRHGGTLNSRRAASPLVRLVEGKERWEAPGHLPQNWGGTKQNRNVICMVLKTKANNGHKNLAPGRDEFRGP